MIALDLQVAGNITGNFIFRVSSDTESNCGSGSNSIHRNLNRNKPARTHVKFPLKFPVEFPLFNIRDFSDRRIIHIKVTVFELGGIKLYSTSLFLNDIPYISVWERGP